MRSPDKTQSLAVLRERGIPVHTVLDVGVLSGTPELIGAYPDRLHILFEPVLEFHPTIRTNYAHIDYRLEGMALSDTNGTARLETRSIISGQDITHSSITTSDRSEDGKTYRDVPMRTLDSYILEHGLEGPFFLKIDVDGFEVPILKGAAQTLRQSSIVMVEAPKYQMVERIKLVQDAGFELYDLAEPCYYDSSFWQCDAILVQRDLHRQHFRQLGTNFDKSLYTKFRRV